MSVVELARRRRRPDPQELVVATITEHADALLRMARRYTGCAADAEDAYQRALEIFVKRAHRLDPATAHKWLFAVCRNEALEVRKQRSRLVGVEDEQELDRLEDGRHLQTVEERAEAFEEMVRAAEALKRCKPQEVTALVLRAQGLSYAEIAERQGWTYTKVNRCLTEGRRAFLQRYAGIEAGEECARWHPVLSALADGEASAAQLAEARPHLRNCPSCRAMLGELHRGTARAAALLPAGLLLGAGSGGATAGGGLVARLGEVLVGVQERVTAPVLKAQAAMEAASATKVAAIAASAAALTGGGVAVERHGGDASARAAGRPDSAQVGPQPGAPPVPAGVSVPPAPDHGGGAPVTTARRRHEPRKTARDRPSPPSPPQEPGEFAAEANAEPAAPRVADPPPAPAAPPPPAPAPAPAEPQPPSAAGSPGEFAVEGG